MSYVLLAKADHRRASVAISSYTGHMANVIVATTVIGSKSVIEMFEHEHPCFVCFFQCKGLMNSRTQPISIKWT